MRTHKRLTFAALLALPTALFGCVFNSTYCEKDPSLIGCDAGGASSSASSTASMMTSTDASSSTGVSPGCVPTLTDGPMDDTCGVFVDPVAGQDGGDGTMAAPLKTLAAAVAEWIPGKAIYLCEGALTDAAGVTLIPGVTAYGGLDCGNGYRVKAETARTVLDPGPGVIPLTFGAGALGIAVQRFEVHAEAAAAAGSSAIGIVIDDVPATLESVDVVVGDGVAGAASVTPTGNIGPSDASDSAIKGNDGGPASTSGTGTPTMGGALKANPLCASTGGKGGDGGEVAAMTAQPGAAGISGSANPLPTMGANDGHAGMGDPGPGCTAGGDGKNGDPAMEGAGAAGASSLGTLALDGYHGVSGGPGADGTPGQGGGGGGGAKGKTTPNTRGASGGSGGAGGCGGKGALGGGPGGSSLGIVHLGTSAPTLTNVKVTTGKGGDGGMGAGGQFGAPGGTGGTGGSGVSTGTNDGCNGGKGGKGSNGGAGGGGRGGHSAGIVYISAAPAGGFTWTGGAAGAAGMSAGAGTPADPGVADDTLQLGAN